MSMSGWDARRAGRERHRPAARDGRTISGEGDGELAALHALDEGLDLGARGGGTISGEEVVELGALHELDEGLDLGARVDEGGLLGEARVADGDRAAGTELGELDAVAGGAEAALAPGDAGQLVGRDSVVHDCAPDLRGGHGPYDPVLHVHPRWQLHTNDSRRRAHARARAMAI